MKNNQDNLPLTETTYYILLSLAPQAKHGYAIMKDVRRSSQERVVLSTGTLYGALKRLLELEWILRSNEPENNHSARIRKTYSLSETGRSVLYAEISRLEQLLRAARHASVNPAYGWTEYYDRNA